MNSHVCAPSRFYVRHCIIAAAQPLVQRHSLTCSYSNKHHLRFERCFGCHRSVKTRGCYCNSSTHQLNA
jgi:hypothetical protein